MARIDEGWDAVAGDDRGGALERAAEPSTDSALARPVTHLVERLLDVGIDGIGPLASARAAADAARVAERDDEAAVKALVRKHVVMGSATGFLTGLGGLVVMPVALPANVAGFYLLATRMVAGIARLRGYDLEHEQVRTAVLLTLVGADADDLLNTSGVVSTGGLANLAAQRLPGPALMILNKAVGFRLATRVVRVTLLRFGKATPIVGGALGAGLDLYLLTRIAQHADREFPPRSA